jgi:hypothetical protein
MTRLLFVLLLAATVTAADTIPANGGDIVITPLIHSSVQIEHAGKVIQVDPWSIGDLSQAKPADLILITDDVGHHLDVKAIEKLRKPGARSSCRRVARSVFPTASFSPTAPWRIRNRSTRRAASRAGSCNRA